jgi:hypothetical protein
LADYANGTAQPADAAKAAQEVQKELGENASNSTGEIRTELLALADVMGRIGVAFTTMALRTSPEVFSSWTLP